MMSDFDPREGDQLLIRQKYFSSVEISLAGRDNNREAQF